MVSTIPMGCGGCGNRDMRLYSVPGHEGALLVECITCKSVTVIEPRVTLSVDWPSLSSLKDEQQDGVGRLAPLQTWV